MLCLVQLPCPSEQTAGEDGLTPSPLQEAVMQNSLWLVRAQRAQIRFVDQTKLQMRPGAALSDVACKHNVRTMLWDDSFKLCVYSK